VSSAHDPFLIVKEDHFRSPISMKPALNMVS